MQPPPIPLDEARRVAAVRSLALLDTPAEERYDRVTRIAMRVLQASAATVSLVDDEREWVKSSSGFPFEQLARGASFAAHAVGTGDLFVISDAAADRRFADHPLVTGAPQFRFYAGQPLHAADGSQPGVLSIYGDVPRRLTVPDRQTLSDLAAIVEREFRSSELSAPQIEAAAAARRTESQRVDPLTRLWNRAAMFDIIRRELDEARVTHSPVAFMIIEIPELWTTLPDRSRGGEWALTEVARVLRASLRPYDVLARFSGREFAALLIGMEESSAQEAAERLRRTIVRELRHGAGCEVDVTVGVTATQAAAADPEALVRAAQSALWNEKSRGQPGAVTD